MGASAQKRKANKAAAEQYYKAFSEVNPIDDYSRISSNNLRSINDEIENASSTSRNQARKLDSLGSQIKNDAELSNLTGLYNARYDILKQQIAGQKTNTLYTITDKPKPVSQISADGNYVANTAQSYIANFTPASNKIDLNNTFVSKNDALNKINNDSSKELKEVNLPQFGVLYRNLNLAEDAVSDLNNLSGAINKTSGSAALQQYSSIAEQLRKRLQKEANDTAPATGLLATNQEVLNGTPYSETIR